MSLKDGHLHPAAGLMTLDALPACVDADPETADVPWRGRWVPVEGSPADVDDLVLAVAARRDADPATVERELLAVGEQFDVDAAYLAPD